MKKGTDGSDERQPDELRPEYELDYSKSRSNRFAGRLGSDVVSIVLEPDVAAVFDTSESVNRFLRSAISAVHGKGPAPPAKKR